MTFSPLWLDEAGGIPLQKGIDIGSGYWPAYQVALDVRAPIGFHQRSLFRGFNALGDGGHAKPEPKRRNRTNDRGTFRVAP